MQHRHSIQVAFATTLSLFVLIASCGRSDPTASSQDASESPQSPAATEVKADATEPVQAESAEETATSEQFFGLLTSSLEEGEQAIHEIVGNEKALLLAQSTCQEFKDGKSFDEISQDVLSGLQSTGLTGEQLDKVAFYSGKVMGAGVTAFCPEYQAEMQPVSQSQEAEPTALAQVQSTAAKTEQFFAVLESTLSDEEKTIHQTVGKQEALNLAQAACQDFEQGKSFDAVTIDVVEGLQEAGLQGDQLQKTAYYSGKVIGVGVAVLCPQHRSQIEG